MNLARLWNIRQNTVFGQAVRWPLRKMSPDARVRIFQGPARGMRWVVGSGPHMYWLGSFEHDKAVEFARSLRPGGIVFDIGAHAGYYSLISARCVGPDGHVYAFEPLLRNISYLRRNISANQLTNVSIVEAAVASVDGRASFEKGSDSSTGHLGGNGLQVETLSLDSWIQKGKLAVPAVIKIDVEGAEVEVLRGAVELLSQRHPLVFLATHGADKQQACLTFLEKCGYRVQLLAADEVVATSRIETVP